MTSTNSASTTGAADVAIAQAQASMRLYNEYYGKLPYTRIAMSQQPYGSFGQSWPTLVYMPYVAFLDQTTLIQLYGARRVSRFNKYIAPHEVAHQWWGHIVGWSSYRDQWMSEGFAEFSASLYVQNVVDRGNLDKYIEFWDSHRKRLVEASPFTKGRKPYTIGPMTQGLRLRSEKTGDAYTPLVYDKGPYILHMLRWMMYDKSNKDGDARFKAMMRDFVQTYYNKDVTTEDFKQVVDKHITREMDLAENGRMDWFFDQWVYGTEIPAYKFEYQITQSGGKSLLSGRITQSGVSDNFRMLVPVWVDLGKGWIRLGSATIVGNSSVELNNIALPKEPKRVAICALDDVLATSIENIKR
jgi:aminopeptidase N